MRILLTGGGTGGHLMPALALAEAMRTLRDDIELVLVGAERGVERTILPNRDFQYHLLPAEPIHRGRWWRNARWPVILPRLWRRTAGVMADVAPALVVGTGGYAAGPVLFAALRRGIPVALQEQNALPGITTRLVAGRARQIHLGFTEARRHLRPGNSTEVFDSGNPIAPLPDPRPAAAAARESLGVDPERPTVFVVGGSQGARAINEAVAAAIGRDLFDGVTVLWSTGGVGWERYRMLHAPPKRIVRAFWDPVGDAYAAADLVVARAGAMTTAELCAWSLPAIYIPLPTAAADHQRRNAQALADAGAAVLLPQSGLDGEGLDRAVQRLVRDRSQLEAMGVAASARGHPKAAEDIARNLLVLVS